MPNSSVDLWRWRQKCVISVFDPGGKHMIFSGFVGKNLYLRRKNYEHNTMNSPQPGSCCTSKVAAGHDFYRSKGPALAHRVNYAPGQCPPLTGFVDEYDS